MKGGNNIFRHFYWFIFFCLCYNKKNIESDTEHDYDLEKATIGFSVLQVSARLLVKFSGSDKTSVQTKLSDVF